MRLSKAAVEAMPTGSKARKRLAYEFNVHINTVDSWVQENDDDGKLTTVTALGFIEEETGLSQKQILTEEKATA